VLHRYEMQPLGRDFLTYISAGAIATVVQYLVWVVAVEGFYLPAWQSTLNGGLAGALIAYVVHHRFTFRSVRAHRSAAPRFAAVALAGTGLQAAAVASGTLILHLHYLLAQGTWRKPQRLSLPGAPRSQNDARECEPVCDRRFEWHDATQLKLDRQPGRAPDRRCNREQCEWTHRA